ncbi:MAG: DNA-3-methyladenine glycosylase 2 family protein [Anaerolineae bacterium]|nr:DNA-3-methyladenine glycosylase 2 family protein [Anaerolineae bacterium]
MTLTLTTLAQAVEWLAARDSSLAHVVQRYGLPPLWPREPGFPTLIHIILEQQVSLASARAAFERLCAAVTPLTPQNFLSLDDAQLKTIGFSRQKTRYGRELASAVLEGRLDVDRLAEWDDEAVRIALKQIKGIGDWTVDVYLLLVLRRPDAFAPGDLALLLAVQQLKGLDHRPTPAELLALAESWRPYRAVAARLLWHFYLNEKGAKQKGQG